MHGRLSTAEHDGSALFAHIPPSFEVVRYLRRFLAYDHLERCWHAVATGPLSARADGGAWLERMAALLRATPEAPALTHGARAEPVEFQLELDREAYRGRIRQCFAQIGDGETQEVCLTNRLRVRIDLDPVELYRHLRRPHRRAKVLAVDEDMVRLRMGLLDAVLTQFPAVDG